MFKKKQPKIMKQRTNPEVVPVQHDCVEGDLLDPRNAKRLNGIVEEFATSPAITIRAPKVGLLIKDNMENAGSPIFYGYSGYLGFIPTPFDESMNSINLHSKMYEDLKDQMFVNNKNDRRNSRSCTINNIVRNITDNANGQFITALINLFISYIVDCFYTELSVYDSDFNIEPYISQEIYSNFNNKRYGFDLVYSWIDFRYKVLKGTNTPEQANGVLLYKLILVKDEILHQLSETLSYIIRAICFGTSLGENGSYNARFTSDSVRQAIILRSKILNDIDYHTGYPGRDKIADLYSHLNAVGMNIVANLNQSIEILLFQLIGTMNYMMSDTLILDYNDEDMRFDY